MNMKLSQHLIYSAVALGIVAASIALPAVVFGADRYASDVTQTESDFVPANVVPAKQPLKEELRCNANKTSCLIVTDRKLVLAHIAVFTRDVCAGANPDIVQINGVWHSRYMCRGVLSETRFAVVSYVPN